MFSLESPHRGDSDEFTQHTILNIKNTHTLNYPKSAAVGFFQGTKERVRKKRCRRAISVRATEGAISCSWLPCVSLHVCLSRWRICLLHLAYHLEAMFCNDNDDTC